MADLVRKGFYIHSSHFPHPRNHPAADHPTSHPDTLFLGPFCGKPACQFINVSPTNARGVCADAFLRQSSKLVPDVDVYPGHIACDGGTKSELVIPLILDHPQASNQVSPIAPPCPSLNGKGSRCGPLVYLRSHLRSDEYGRINVPGIQVSNIPDGPTVVGVLDLDCLALSGFQEEDRLGLERIARLITDSCDW